MDETITAVTANRYHVVFYNKYSKILVFEDEEGNLYQVNWYPYDGKSEYIEIDV